MRFGAGNLRSFAFFRRIAPARRSLLTILIVATIAGWISQGERAAGLSADREGWIRTVDGWESRGVLETEAASTAPPIHPGLIAAFQLGASLFFLLAFPAEVRVLRSRLAPAPAEAARRRRRRAPALSRAAG